jgi:uncharacterized damage-inducible protein DinB
MPSGTPASSIALADTVRFSIAHSAWALARLLDHARGLTDEQFNRDLGIGPGSLRANIAHTLEAMFYFAGCFAERPYVEPHAFASDSLTVEGLSRLLGASRDSLQADMLGAIARGLSGPIAWESAPSGRAAPVVAIAQVFDHATLHRTQCIHILKRLGVSPLPDLDPLSFEASGLPW